MDRRIDRARPDLWSFSETKPPQISEGSLMFAFITDPGAILFGVVLIGGAIFVLFPSGVK